MIAQQSSMGMTPTLTRPVAKQAPSQVSSFANPCHTNQVRTRAIAESSINHQSVNQSRSGTLVRTPLQYSCLRRLFHPFIRITDPILRPAGMYRQEWNFSNIYTIALGGASLDGLLACCPWQTSGLREFRRRKLDGVKYIGSNSALLSYPELDNDLLTVTEL